MHYQCFLLYPLLCPPPVTARLSEQCLLPTSVTRGFHKDKEPNEESILNAHTSSAFPATARMTLSPT